MTESAFSGETLGRFQHNRMRLLWVAALLLAPVLLLTGSAWAHGRWAASGVVGMLQTAGFLLIAFGVMGRIWTIAHIGGRKSTQLVVTGPYSISRNPLYLSSAVAMAGVGATAGSVTMMIALFSITTTAFAVTARREEAYLEQHHGDEYRAYIAAVPRFWPRFKIYHERAEFVTNADSFRRTVLQSATFFAVIPALGIIGWLQAKGILPVLARFW
jgi:protein-S-isoprenylcysteine O-methyltransferase Ste14